MESVSVSNWNISNKHSEEESIESYIKAWDAIKTLEVGPSHVNLAAEIANMFVKGGHYANMVHFVNSLDDNFLDKMKENEKFVRALLSLRMTQRKYNEVFSLLENGNFSNKDGLLDIWDEAHYREWEERMGKPLNALLRYRIRQRFLPPEHICPNGTRPTTRLPDQALQILRAWLLDHPTDPYPSKIDKDLLMKNSGLSLSQVKTWFANARRRLRLKKESKSHKPKGGHPSSCSEIEADVSCSDGLSDSPEDLLSGEDTAHKEESGESRYGGDFQQVDGLSVELKQVEKTPSGDFFIPYAGKNQFYNNVVHQQYQPQNFTYDTISEQKIEKHDVARAVRSAATSGEKLISTQVSTSYRPKYHHSIQTSEYLKALAGMCEDISPSTYQLGMPRIPAPKHPICPTVPDYHPQRQPRPAYYQVLQDETVRYLSYQQSPGPGQPQSYTPFRPVTCNEDTYSYKQKKWYQGREISRDQTVSRPYSMSAPPSLGVLTNLDTRHTYHQTNSVSQGHPQEPPWPTYQQSYTSSCFLGCNTVAPCTACKPTPSRLTSDPPTVPLPPFGLAMMGTSVATPAIHQEPPPAPLRRTPSHPNLSNQSLLQWSPMNNTPTMKYRATTLPAFAASFTVPASSVPLPSIPLNFIQQQQHQQQQGQGHRSSSPTSREQPRQQPPKRSIEPCTTSVSVVAKKRQRHQSQPVRPGDRQFEPSFPMADDTPSRLLAPGQVPMNTEQMPPCKPNLKRSCSITEEELTKTKDTTLPPVSDWSKRFSRPTSQDNIVNGQPAHVKTTSASASQTVPPNAHTHLKRKDNCMVDAKEALDFPSLAPSLSTPTPANSTESQEGMKEIAQVLLDLSTKGPQTSVANSCHNITR
ncbi:uncharacterized protein [Haliotis asinina]|uniref:uncharacterized protein n=1 Tax=Haliotis asinina TaxID=109174 RepID=UPI0035324337